jgi:predicted RecA/RadA family phage recombinase
MSNFIQDGRVIDYTNSTETDIAYHDIVVLGNRVGVAAEDIAVGNKGGVIVEGVFEVPAIGTEAFTVGQVAYLNAGGKATVTKDALTTVIGWVVEPKLAAGTTAKIKIN